MLKPLALSIAACLALAGCHVFEKSETWNQAVRVRPGEATLDPDPSYAYAAKLHAAFAESGVPHKVVVYQYHYTTRGQVEAVGTRTAVIYRDDSNPSYPWWLKDDRLNNPFWLPNGDADKQVSFYIRRKAEVIETKDYPGHGGSGKATVAFAGVAPAPQPIAKPQPRIAVTHVVPAKKAPVTAVAKKPEAGPVPATTTQTVTLTSAANAPKTAAKAPEVKKAAPQQTVAKAPVTRMKLPTPSFFAQRPSDAGSTPLPPIASRNSGTTTVWAPPAVLDSNQQSALTAPRDERLEKLFRAKNGTEYNRFSATDRRKMQQLQHEVASRE